MNSLTNFSWNTNRQETLLSVYAQMYPSLYNHIVEYVPLIHISHILDCLAGLVVKASATTAEDPGFESRLQRDFSGSSHTSDLKIGTPVATLPGAWHCRVNAGTGWPCVTIL